MTPVGVFFCWQGGAERDFVNSTTMARISSSFSGVSEYIFVIKLRRKILVEKSRLAASSALLSKVFAGSSTSEGVV